MVFIRCPAHSKGYVIYKEHPNGGMTEIGSRNFDFFENEFPSIDEIKKDLELYELQHDLQPSLREREDLNSRQVTENGEPAQGNEVRLHIPTPMENQLKMLKVHMHRTPCLKGIVGVILHKLGLLLLLEKGGIP